MIDIVADKLPAIRELCRQYGVARLDLFGSAATDDFDAARSAVDFLVHYPPGYDYGPWISRHLAFEADLARVLGRDVDLIMSSALRKERFRREADKTRTVIYDAANVASVA